MITLNGKPAEGDGRTIADLLQSIDVPAEGRGIAVAVDAEVVPHSLWDSTALADGQRVEVVGAIQGG